MVASLLSASEPEVSDAARALRARLRDVEAHLSQFAMQFVAGEDGRLYLAAAAHPSGVDEEPYPYRTPLTRLPGFEDLGDIDLANATSLSRIEARINEFALQNPTANGQTVLARMNPAGFVESDFRIT